MADLSKSINASLRVRSECDDVVTTGISLKVTLHFFNDNQFYETFTLIYMQLPREILRKRYKF